MKDFMAGNFLAGDFMAGDFLAHHVTFRDFMAGNCLAGDFLGWIQYIHSIIMILLFLHYDRTHELPVTV